MSSKKKLRIYALAITLLLGIIFILASIYLYRSYNDVLSIRLISQIALAVATALLAAVVLGLLKLDDISKFEGLLETYSEMQKRGVRKIGLPTHFDDEIKEKLKELRRGSKVQVMLHAGQTFITTFKPYIIDAVERGCDVEILISSPNVSVDYHSTILRTCAVAQQKQKLKDSKMISKAL